MPLLLPTGLVTVGPSLVGVGMLGVGTPKLTQGIVQGVLLWATSRSISTKDVGTAGVGKGTGSLALVTPATLYPILLAESIGQGMVGPFTPIFLAGLSSGLSSFLSTAIISTTHPSVGAGTAIASVAGPPSTLSFQQGMGMAELTGDTSRRLAIVLGNTFDKVLPFLPFPVVIVGPSSPSPSTGVGVGKVI